jgi:molybdate transport system permease protein
MRSVRLALSWLPRVLAGGAAGVALLLLGLPVLALLARAFGSGLVSAAFGSSVVLDALVLSLITTSVSLLLALVFGTPLAFLLARRTGRGWRLAEVLVDLPIVLPPSVAGLALLLLLGRRGVLGGFLSDAGVSLAFSTAAVVLAQTFVSAPFFIRSARTGFATVDRNVEKAARHDGATEWQQVRHVTFPMAGVALRAGIVLCWARALGEFGATIMFAGNVERQTQTLPLVVYAEFQDSLDASVAAAAVLVLAAIGILVAIHLGGRTALSGAEPAAR